MKAFVSIAGLALTSILVSLSAPLLCHASETVHLPVRLDYPFLRALLSREVYTEQGDRAVIAGKEEECNRIELQVPEMGPEQSLIKIGSHIKMKAGVPFFGECVALADWKGYIDVLQKVTVDRERRRLKFETVGSRLYNQDRKQVEVPVAISNLVSTYVHPFLDKLSVDLRMPLEALKGTLPLLFATEGRGRAQQWVQSLRLGEARVERNGVALDLLMEVETWGEVREGVAALSPSEIGRLTKAWEIWDDYFVYQIETLVAQPLMEGERNNLLETLLVNRHGFVQGLSEGRLSRKLVREQFIGSWERISSTLRKYLIRQRSLSPLDYLSFFTVADAIAALDKAGAALELDLGRDAFLKLSRLLSGGAFEPALEYSYGVNPKLRRLLGLGAPLDETGPAFHAKELDLRTTLKREILDRENRAWVRFLSPLAHAEEGTSPDLEEVAQWVPPPDQDFFEYLGRVRALLEEEGATALKASKLDGKYHDFYHTLLLATAWQESCWRQFFKSQGKISALVSYNQSSVGVMQINERVWRGIYRIESLRWNIRYNIRAGTEIVDTYLQRYALKRMDPHNPLDTDTLARVVYAMYNGGPGQFYKFLKRREANSFWKSDDLFWEKYVWTKADQLGKLSICLLGRDLGDHASTGSGGPKEDPGKPSD